MNTTAERSEPPMASVLDLKGMNWFLAMLVRKLAKTDDREGFEEAFGVSPERAEAIVAQWELCAMPYWGGDELASMIATADATRSPKIIARSIELAQKAGEVPESFRPSEGIEWAMARGFAIRSDIAMSVGVQPGSYGNPHSGGWAPSDAKQLPIAAAAPALPAVAVETTVANWAIEKPERDDGLAGVLYAALARSRARGEAIPTARDLLALWRIDPPRPIVEVLAAELKFENGEGDYEVVGLRALTARIRRMTAR